MNRVNRFYSSAADRGAQRRLFPREFGEGSLLYCTLAFGASGTTTAVGTWFATPNGHHGIAKMPQKKYRRYRCLPIWDLGNILLS